MKKPLLFAIVAGAALLGCGKDESNNIGGGNLPAKYIFLEDSTLTPMEVNLVSGGAVQFVNRTSLQHTLMSDDSTTFQIVLPPLMSVYYRPDTLPTSTISIPFHCVEHPVTQGLITIAP